MLSNKKKASWWIIIAFMIVPIITSLVSTIHVVSFFELSNYYTLSIILAVAFELGALSSLAGLVVMDKISKSTVWLIFILLTGFQMMGNTYYAYDTTSTKMLHNSDLIKNFTELFAFDIYDNSDVIFVKRIIAVFSGAILPIISLCFLHLLMSYVMGSSKKETESITQPNITNNTSTFLNAENFNNDENKIHPVHQDETVVIEENKTEQNNNHLNKDVSKENSNEEDFTEYLKTKKEKLEKDKITYSELLKILFKDGTCKKGDELPSYKEFFSLVDKKFDDTTIKTFLMLCNYLSITKVNGEQKVALASYDEAQNLLTGYLSLGNLD